MEVVRRRVTAPQSNLEYICKVISAVACALWVIHTRTRARATVTRGPLRKMFAPRNESVFERLEFGPYSAVGRCGGGAIFGFAGLANLSGLAME